MGDSVQSRRNAPKVVRLRNANRYVLFSLAASRYAAARHVGRDILIGDHRSLDQRKSWSQAMVKAVAVASLVAAIQIGGASGQKHHHWSGSWTSRGDRDVAVVRIVPGSGSASGWSGFVEALLATRDYRIEIAHTAESVAIVFPGGSSNMLTLPETPLDAGSGSRVVNRGDWWTKYVTSAHFAGGVLDVASTTFTGWWRDGGPDAAKPKATDYRRRLTLTQGSHPDQLVLRVHLADEKGEVQYIQNFRREH